MACGCANRMRKYILPTMGYTLQEGVWKNSDIGNVDLQDIPDEEIGKYYTELTARIAIAYGKKRFYNWWSNVAKGPTVNIEDHWNMLTTKYREYQNERQDND